MSKDQDDKAGLVRALIAGITANLALALTKFVAFAFTGSSAMLAEAFHSTADCSNQGLLALGLKRARKAPDAEHPLGYGKERYFWSFIVAILIFVMGGAFAVYEGLHKFADPEPIQNVGWSYAALAIGLLVEGFALRVAWAEFRHFREQHPGPLIAALRKVKDPTLPTVLMEDGAAILGLVLALIGVSLATWTGDTRFDAIASVLIGILLFSVAWFLASESHSLLIDESAAPEDRQAIRQAAEAHAAVESLVDLITLQRAPDEILVLLTVRFRKGLDAERIEAAVAAIEDAIRSRVPTVVHVYIEAGSQRTSRAAAT